MEVEFEQPQNTGDHFDMPPVTFAYVKNIPVQEEPKVGVKAALSHFEDMAFKLYMAAFFFYLGLMLALYIVERTEKRDHGFVQ